VQSGLEGGLDLPAPPAPVLAVHHGEALAEERAHARDGRALGVGARVVLEHVLDVMRMTEQIDAMRAESHGHEVAVAAHAFREEAEWIAAGHGEHAHERKSGGPGWRAASRGSWHARAPQAARGP
jgi:hypothetical protein